MYKMFNINKETYENNNTETIIDGIGMWWLNEKHIERMLVHKNLLFITNKYDQTYKKHRHELVNEPKKTTKQKIFTHWFGINNNNEL